ncbi:MAG: hypothetical protein HY243_05530 [Proteobacteria bacterium]|nr:hypothetical protein [Pseudomonadota bacterium]
MTTRARKNHSAESSADPAGTWNLLDSPLTKLMEHNRTLAEHTLKALQEESLRFVNLRLEHTNRAIQESRDCSGFTGLLAVQNDWFASFAHDYLEQSRRLTDLLREIAERSTSALSETAVAPMHLKVHKNEHGERHAA